MEVLALRRRRADEVSERRRRRARLAIEDHLENTPNIPDDARAALTRAYASDDVLDEALENMGRRRGGLFQQMAAEGGFNWRELFAQIIKALLPILLELLGGFMGGVSIPTAATASEGEACGTDKPSDAAIQWQAIVHGLRTSARTGVAVAIEPRECRRILEAMGVS